MEPITSELNLEVKAKKLVLKELVSEQDHEIQSLSRLLDSKSSDFGLNHLESDLKIEIEALSNDVIQHLNDFAQVCPVVGLNEVQHVLKLIEEISNHISNYSKIIDFSLEAIDISIYQQLLRSDQSDEFTNLCHEKKRLESFSIKNLKQQIFAKSAYEKYKTAMKAFEDFILNEEKFRKTENLVELIEGNQKENAELHEKIEETISKIDKICEEIEEVNIDSIQFENIDLLLKKKEFRDIKSLEISDLIENLKRNALLGLSSIMLEQEEIQMEYDKLFQIQSLFEEITSQIEFRINSYPKLKLRAEAISEERKTIDERDKVLNDVFKNICGESLFPQNFQALLSSLQKVVQKSRENVINIKEKIENTTKECTYLIKNYEKLLETLKLSQNTQDLVLKERLIAKEIDKLSEKFQNSLSRFENLSKSPLISASGISEREIFIQYLTEKSPEFLLECDNL